MKKMNKNILIPLGFLLLFMCSCNILDQEPLDFATDASTYYNNPRKLESALAGVYDVLGTGNHSYGWGFLYYLGLEADEGYYAYGYPGPALYNFTAGDNYVEGFWRNFYTGISRANLLIQNIESLKNSSDIEISQSILDAALGEALFLRGYYYFLLVQTYGDVPLITKFVDDATKVYVERTPTKEVYEQILKDMKRAEELVLPITETKCGGRVNKSAVRGILARVNLFMAGNPLNDKEKYKDAIYWARKVMNDTTANHSLNPSYSQVFINYIQDKYDIKESLWEVEFYGNNSGVFQEGGAVGNLNGIPTKNTTIGDSYGGVKASAKLYNSYEEGDLRRDWAIANFTYNDDGTKKLQPAPTPKNLYDRYPGKYRREFEVLVPKLSKTPTNFPLLRYSDVLLMFAEAENEVNGPTQAAIDAVNLVRRRAWSTGRIKFINIINGGTGYDENTKVKISGGTDSIRATVTVKNGQVVSVDFASDPVYGYANGSGYTSQPKVEFIGSGTGAEAVAYLYYEAEADVFPFEAEDKDTFRKIIQKERMRELCFETLRKPDLIRWGIFLEEMQNMAIDIEANYPRASFLERYKLIWEKHLLWPIPAREISLNKKLTQNPNW